MNISTLTLGILIGNVSMLTIERGLFCLHTEKNRHISPPLIFKFCGYSCIFIYSFNDEQLGYN